MITALALTVFVAASSPEHSADDWPLWRAYVAHFVSADGRVIDRTDRDRTTSEGQAYALFFALVANDQKRFAQLLRWTEDNLSAGRLDTGLPAWLWGRRKNGSWAVLDGNSAADADLWLSYTLLEAGRLWHAPRFDRLGRLLLRAIATHEVIDIDPGAALLLPGPRGFVLDGGRRVRLNPSYTPIQVLRRLSALEPTGPWQRIIAGSLRMLTETTPHGLAADWVVYERGNGFSFDPVSGPSGSYDAIRTYLWAAMLDPGDPQLRTMQSALGGLYAHWRTRETLPERVDVRSGEVLSAGAPVGFFAALLPWCKRFGQRQAGAAVAQELAAQLHDGLYGAPPAYYDQNLVLFGQGFSQGRYNFAVDGALRPSWESRCNGQ